MIPSLLFQYRFHFVNTKNLLALNTISVDALTLSDFQQNFFNKISQIHNVWMFLIHEQNVLWFLCMNGEL